ncbi:hypothetical protein [Marininema halotolerans]|uniref:Uncharacterized protein n=1 Tax=Marininema halotolerans TaxID=1155944 RepID=A0A1I6UEV4_9BACL|nr:hypothetical protein [Marininema halotolerans]SFS99918.1 hypothetical protein SAMN05444972_1169 [Marininema halotolerans]
MFFSLLYLCTLFAIVIFTIMIIMNILNDRSIQKWLSWLTGVVFFYLFSVWISTLF